MRKKAALVLGMAITFSQVAMAEEITSSTEQIENCTPETSVQEENFQETEQQSNVNEVQESVSEDEEVQMQESTIHNNESGVYYTHIYVYDVNGAYALEGITVRVPAVAEAPVIKKIETSNVTTAGYTVKVTFSAQLGVKEVKMPTWTEKNGQDDIVWHVANISGNTATAYIPTSAHNNEVGNYITHVYVVDKKNNEAVEAVYVTVK